MDVRLLRPSDIPHVQLANITNLPENYFCKYYLYHAMSWPQLSYVAVDVRHFPLPMDPFAQNRCLALVGLGERAECTSSIAENVNE